MERDPVSVLYNYVGCRLSPCCRFGLYHAYLSNGGYVVYLVPFCYFVSTSVPMNDNNVIIKKCTSTIKINEKVTLR